MSRTKKILILAANPKGTPALRLDQEVREIDEGLRRSKKRDQFIIEQKLALRIKDLRRALLDTNPQIVHFCGHGEIDGIILEDEVGQSVTVPSQALADLFALFADKIECILLNSCYSEAQTETIRQHINYVIGMRKEIGDEAAIEFAIGFYDALGAGRSIDDAFKFGYNAIQLKDISDHLIPILKKKTKPFIIEGVHLFTEENREKIILFRSHSLLNATYGTFNTEYKITHQALIDEIKQKIDENHFMSIYGNSGRGKTFFVFDFIESIVDQYDVIYYSPHFDNGSVQSTYLVRSVLDYLQYRGKKILFIIDDSHLVVKEVKSEILSQKDSNLYFLVVSRSREKDIVPSEYKASFKSFNQIAEKIFDSILEKFCLKYNIPLDDNLKHKIEDEIEGANLVFLTLILQSWDELLLLGSGKKVSFGEIRKNAYQRFIERYKERSENWKYINHIVSAFFQYEIKIDQVYLSPKLNEHLTEKGLEDYMKDRMIFDSEFYEDDKLHMFYVFMDFVKGEESYMMRHAAEFRFYLKAYNGRLSFRNNHNLDRVQFTILVLQDYIKFKHRPQNIGEIRFLIRQNTENKKEAEIIISNLLADPEVRSILIEEDTKYLVKSKHRSI